MIATKVLCLLFGGDTVERDDVGVSALLAPVGEAERCEDIVQTKKQKLGIVSDGEQVVFADDMQLTAPAMGACASA